MGIPGQYEFAQIKYFLSFLPLKSVLAHYRVEITIFPYMNRSRASRGV